MDLPGRTDKIEHNIQLAGQENIRQKLYRLPEAKKELVRKEIDQLLDYKQINNLLFLSTC
jgi:hypothetical protein